MNTTDKSVLTAIKTIEDDAPLAVRARRGDGAIAVLGTVTHLDEAAPWMLKLNDAEAWWWEETAPAVVKKVDYVGGIGPPKLVRRGEKDEYCAAPGLIRNGKSVELVVPEPVVSRGQVEYYTAQPWGTVTEIETPPVVAVAALLPDGHTTTEVHL